VNRAINHTVNWRVFGADLISAVMNNMDSGLSVIYFFVFEVYSDV
jgi:hypothetical protein